MSDHDQFQGQKEEIQTQVLKPEYQCNVDYSQTVKKQSIHNWKYQKIIKAPQIYNQRAKPKNISFQTEDYSFQQINYDSEEEYKSPLASMYQNCEQVYQKRKPIGIDWIGNKQFYASIFVDPSKIQKLQSKPFRLFSDTLEHIPSRKNEIIFDSQFQSGNLFCAYKVGNNEYDLMMQNDVNTKGNTQWFYFRMRNIPAKEQIKINIVNMMKSDSLFNYGMLPCFHSKQAELRNSQGWVRKGSKVQYFRNRNLIQNSRRYYHTLTFSISTNYINDEVRIAQCYPYTLTDLKNFLDNLNKNNEKKHIISRQSIGQTIGKNQIQVITIKQPNPRKKIREVIVILARQHPGETPGSYVCQGFLNFIMSKERQAEYLRKNYQFKVIPMMNPDGVLVGNYRTNLMGFDLNRRWAAHTNQNSSNFRLKNRLQSYIVRQYILDLSKKSSISTLIDLHGHSRKMFSFFYGNPSNTDPCLVRIFPYLCSKLGPNLIRFQDSTFSYQDCKRKTARIQLNLALKIANIYTFETSFFGYYAKDLHKKHFTQEGFRNLGQILAKSLFIQEFQKTYSQSKECLFYKKLLSDLRNNQNLIKIGDRDQSGSQTDPSQCQISSKDQQKLDSNDQYSKDSILPKNRKIIKKMMKKQMGKEVAKSSRQMMVMDVPRVNSICPNYNDILALIPSSYIINPKPKKDKREFFVQCDEIPVLKIYQACKNEQSKQKVTKMSVRKDIKAINDNIFFGKRQFFGENRMQKIADRSSNLFKTVLRPRSSSTNQHIQIHCQGNSNPKTIHYKQIRQYRQNRQESGTQLKRRKIILASKMTQTYLTFRPNFEFSGQSYQISDDELVKQQKMSFSTIQNASVYGTGSGLGRQSFKANYQNAGFKVGLKAINIETWKIKKKSLYGFEAPGLSSKFNF